MDNNSLLRLTNQIKKQYLEDILGRLRNELYVLNEGPEINTYEIAGFELAFRTVAETEEWLHGDL
jgi:hypothetical protein